MPNIGGMELLVILGIAVLVFGTKRIPEIAKSLGSSINSFKAGLKENHEE